MSEYMPEHMPEDMPDRMPEDMSEYMPEDMPDRMPDRMPEDMSDRMPEDMPDRMHQICQIECQKICQKICQIECQIDCQKICQIECHKKMPEDMPDRMPEDMSDRMPEDLPVRKSINVMVGSHEVKYFFISFLYTSTNIHIHPLYITKPKIWCLLPPAKVNDLLLALFIQKDRRVRHRPQGGSGGYLRYTSLVVEPSIVIEDETNPNKSLMEPMFETREDEDFAC